MSFLISILELISIAIWVAAIADSLKNQREWAWLFLVVCLPPIGVPLYFINFFVLESFGWRRVDLGISRRRRIKQLTQLREVQDTTAIHRELGELHYQVGNWKEALASLKVAMDRDAEDLKTQFLAGASLLEIGRPQDALPHLRFVVDEEPKYLYGEAQLLLGRAEEQTGDVEAAFETYSRVLQNYTYPEAVVRHARLLCSRGQQDHARELLRRTIKEARGLPQFNPARDRRWLREAKSDLARLGG